MRPLLCVVGVAMGMLAIVAFAVAYIDRAAKWVLILGRVQDEIKLAAAARRIRMWALHW